MAVKSPMKGDPIAGDQVVQPRPTCLISEQHKLHATASNPEHIGNDPGLSIYLYKNIISQQIYTLAFSGKFGIARFGSLPEKS
jgi:hypothetical protein